jgi:prenyltransferase beta subunit
VLSYIYVCGLIVYHHCLCEAGLAVLSYIYVCGLIVYHHCLCEAGLASFT